MLFVSVVFFNVIQVIPILLKYSIKALEPLKCFEPVFSCLLIKSLNFALYVSLAYKKCYQYLVYDLLA